MVGRCDLGKRLRLSFARFVAANAEHSDIYIWRLQGGWIVRMFRQWSVAGFAGHMSVDALRFFLQHVCMAAFAGAVAGEYDGFRGKFLQSSTAVMAVLPKALWYEDRAGDQEHDNSGSKYCCHTNEMT